MRFHPRILCFLMAAALPQEASSQSANSPTPDTIAVGSNVPDAGVYKTIRGIAELQAQTRIDLARFGSPLYYKNSFSMAQPLATIISEVCGEQPEPVVAFITEAALALNGLKSGSDEVARGDVVAIPFCLRVESDVTVKIKPGDSPSSILVSEYGVSGPKTLDRFYKMNLPHVTSAKIEEFSRNLQVGKMVLVPFSSEKRVFVEDPTSEKTLQDIVTSIDNPNTRVQLESVIAPTVIPPESTEYRLDYVPSVEFSGASSAENCRGEVGQSASVYDEQALRDRFDAEMKARAVFFSQNPPERSVVGIIDSGVNKAADPTFFTDELFEANMTELNGLSGEDNDDNGHKHDVYGTNFYGNSGVIDPLPKGPEEQHGSKMASLILGGPDLAPKWFGPSPPIRIKVVNFSSVLSNARTVDATKLRDAIDYLKGQGSSIVNLSLATNEKLLSLKNSIRAETGLLFVVAAGNSKNGGGNNLTFSALYPARYGGRASGNDHVVTVGAYDLSGGLAGFSNYSTEFVDILAPGCAVRVRSGNPSVTLENGTSAATAITSFAAGLIRALGVKEPADIKNRLIVGTDFDNQLNGASWSSGRLNIIKAISIFDDVIETNESPNELIFGKVEDLADVYRQCKTPPPSHDPQKLRKVVYDVDDNGTAKIEFWIEVDDKLTRQIRCDRAPDNDSTISLRLLEGQVRKLRVSGLREVTLATLKVSN
ncbi:S8 family serine peptidase [Rhizobium johnstonii]|uniref:S8 family serine peptidase n=1 Tax=Rhizobium johnstonii TaxID=3019933 RepID=UPI003F9CD2F5